MKHHSAETLYSLFIITSSKQWIIKKALVSLFWICLLRTLIKLIFLNFSLPGLVTNIALSWVKSNLVIRTFYVSIGGSVSSVFQLLCGMPWGSVLVSSQWFVITNSPSSTHLKLRTMPLNHLLTLLGSLVSSFMKAFRLHKHSSLRFHIGFPHHSQSTSYLHNNWSHYCL